MDEDSLIRVLHYRNPHLLWVELKCHDTFTLRQVGLFGIVPRLVSLVDGERVCTKSDRWDPRADEIVEEFLESKHPLYFKPTYRLDDDNHPTSIFPDQPHIFGEISIVKKQDGVRKQLLNCLDNSVYAYKSRNEFWQMLNDGKIKTKLEESEELLILEKVIETYKAKGIWNRKKDDFFKYLSPSQVTKLRVSTPELTVENLEKHHNLTLIQNAIARPEKFSKPRSKNYHDFSGNSEELAPVQFVEDVLKKFTAIDNQPNIESHKLYTIQKSVEPLSKITVYDEEMKSQDYGDNRMDAFLESQSSQKGIGRANSRTFNNRTPEINSTNEEIRDVEKNMFKQKYRQLNRNYVQIESGSQNSIESSRETEKKQYTQNGFKNIQTADKKTAQKISQNECKSNSQLSENDKASSNGSPTGMSKERPVAFGPPEVNLRTLVNKQTNNKIDDSPKKVVENTEPTRNGGKVNWNDECQTTKINESELLTHLPKNIVNFDVNCRSIDKNCLETEVEGKDVNDCNSYDNDQMDLKYRKYNNDLVQNKQILTNVKDMQSRSGRHVIVSEKQNDKSAIHVSYDKNVNDNKENKTKTQKSRSKLLDIMRKRETMFKDSILSDDNSIIKDKNHQLKNDSQSRNDTTTKSNDSDEDLEEILAKLNIKPLLKAKPLTPSDVATKGVINVNPYKNLDGSKSVFVDNLVQPLLFAHTKNNNKILPQSKIRDIPFKFEIHRTLQNKNVKNPSRLQSVSWPYILRGHSMIIIGAVGSGKTLGYLPAVCNLVMDYNFDFPGLGPICIIVCGTALSVSNTATECGVFLNKQKVIACYPGVDNLQLAIDLINGCDILVATPTSLCRLLSAEIGVDLRRLTTLAFDDCERLDHVYGLEVKAIDMYVKQMLKSRTDKQVKVQYVLASRKWCDFMTPLAKKAPDTIVAFAAFHECVLYSKANTSVSFVKKNNKVDAVIEFLKDTDDSKLTVIVCRSDDEVDLLESTLKSLNITVVACNNQMTIHDLYKIRTEELSSILICCDGNLNHLNVNYANYLVHFSLPAVYSQFCKRFAVLNENYPSIFESANKIVKIKILLEENNVEELPKILNFVKRCSNHVPEVLNEVARKVLEQKEVLKAERMVPVCSCLMALGECEDFYTCQERHALLEGYDDPKSWMPCNGVITFKILNYKSAISYSARLLTHMTDEDKIKYPETYATLCMKLGMFFSKEDNKRLHGEPKVGDICAVAVRKNFIARCQVLKINDYEKGMAKFVVINLIDEEEIAVIRAVELYFLPETFKTVETYVAKVRLAAIMPQDKDVTFSELALNKLKKLTDADEQLYLKGRIAMTVGNTIFVSTLEACSELHALGETVVKYDFKDLLLESHASPNPDHLSKLQKICEAGNLKIKNVTEVKAKGKPRVVKKETEYHWAHLDKNNWCDVIFSNTINAGTFFVRLDKFSKCVNSLVSDIKRHVAENPEIIENVCVNDFVLAEFPDDAVYERAMIEEIIDESKVKCFFVDNADWRDVAVNKLKPIPQKFIKQIPFQSIECRLIGVKPPGEEWTEFSTNWLHDNCLEDVKGDSKRIYVKYYTKEKAKLTGGNKYGVILVDTTTENDIVINKRMVELNLAVVDQNEIEFLEMPFDFVREKTDTSSNEDDFDDLGMDTKDIVNSDRRISKDLVPIPIKHVLNDEKEVYWETNNVNKETIVINDKKIIGHAPKFNDPDIVPITSLKNIFTEKPLKSFPLVSDSDENLDKWDICIDESFGKCLGLPKLAQSYNNSIKKENAKRDDYDEFLVVTDKRKNAISTPIKSKLPAIAAVSNERDNHNIITDDEQIDKKYTNNVDKKSINRKIIENVETKAINSEALTEVKNTTETEPKEDLKVESKYDSNELEDSDDDTLTITMTNSKMKTSVREPIKNLSNKDASVLDSDDTQSFMTEIDKELNEEIKNPNKSLDSDDFEFEMIDEPATVTTRKVEIDKKVTIALKKDEDNEIDCIKSSMSKLRMFAANIKPGISTVESKLKMIPITELTKTENAMSTNAENHQLSNTGENNKIEVNTEINKVDIKSNTEDVNDATELKGRTITVTGTKEPIRKPQLVWKQDKHTITVKIKVVVDEYTLETGDRSLKFSGYQNEIKYAFDVDLYGVIEKEKTTHSNKGQYIQVTMIIMLKKTTKWLKLTKGFNSWIGYDVDSIDTSSDEETPANDDALKIILDQHEKAMELDDDDDDIDDTSGYRYRDED